MVIVRQVRKAMAPFRPSVATQWRDELESGISRASPGSLGVAVGATASRRIHGRRA